VGRSKPTWPYPGCFRSVLKLKCGGGSRPGSFDAKKCNRRQPVAAICFRSARNSLPLDAGWASSVRLANTPHDRVGSQAAGPTFAFFMSFRMTLLHNDASRARDWLFKAALPLWLEGAGFDPTTGLFAERLDAQGRSLPLNRRVRVQARQAYVCAEAAALGWTGNWREPLEAAVATLTGKARRSDGAFVHMLSPNGAVIDDRADLYDHAFGQFALAKAAVALDQPDLLEVIEEGWGWLDSRWSHPAGGYREGEIVSADMRRQNPHMHLFEAALALHDAFPGSTGLERSRGFAKLFMERFFDTVSYALPEYFDAEWSPLPGEPGRVTEPGHQFEWAWLLRTYADVSGDTSVLTVAARLVEHGRQHGVDAARGVAINEVEIDGSVISAAARLWPQTERLKAAVSGLPFDRVTETREASAALDGLFLYLDKPGPGLWRDTQQLDGRFDDEASPASSLYHIVCAIGELCRAAQAQPR
jgi:mannose/cellobiose epimerase-like protein (N-acyl-D-glucosamine 2-epimerase family)